MKIPEYLDTIKITDKYGFVHTVTIKHNPSLGLSTAYYEDDIINIREYSKISQPMSDNDYEWEMFEGSLAEYREMAIIDLTPECVNYFNRKYITK